WPTASSAPPPRSAAPNGSARGPTAASPPPPAASTSRPRWRGRSCGRWWREPAWPTPACVDSRSRERHRLGVDARRRVHPEVGGVLQDLSAGDRHLVGLARSAGGALRALVGVHLGHRREPRDTGRAVPLDAAVPDI